jgi:hypothetical protein
MANREDVHRLVDAVPEARLPAVEWVLRASLDGPLPEPPRRLASAGTLSAEHDLAERSEDILREDPGQSAELVESCADLPLGTVDASVIALTERLALPAVATLDHRHFTVVRPRHISALTLLP